MEKEYEHDLTKLTEKQKNMYKNIPEGYRNPYFKGLMGSKANATKARCLDCCCWQPKEVKLCPAEDCPNWNVRPYNKKP